MVTRQKEFEALYKELHIEGYYRGILEHVDTVRTIFRAAKAFIDRLK